VPANRVNKVSTQSGAALGKAGVKLLATLPEDRGLYALSIADLGDAVNGEALTALDRASKLVTSLMLGITGLDRNPAYFTRQPGHAAVLRVRAADLQMAAINADAKCLILTGEGDVSENVQHLAEIKGVPVIKVAGKTAEAVASIEDAFVNGRFHQTAKLARLDEVTGKLELAAV
jgi:BioD-like phosphotransacetylase family protein